MPEPGGGGCWLKAAAIPAAWKCCAAATNAKCWFCTIGSCKYKFFGNDGKAFGLIIGGGDRPGSSGELEPDGGFFGEHLGLLLSSLSSSFLSPTIESIEKPIFGLLVVVGCTITGFGARGIIVCF